MQGEGEGGGILVDDLVRVRGGTGEVQGRYRGDTGEVQARGGVRVHDLGLADQLDTLAVHQLDTRVYLARLRVGLGSGLGLGLRLRLGWGLEGPRLPSLAGAPSSPPT